MPYKSFEDLDAWKRPCRLATNIYRHMQKCKDYGLRDQMTPLSGINNLQHSRRCRARFHTRIQATPTHGQKDRNTRARRSGRISRRDTSHISQTPSPSKFIEPLKPNPCPSTTTPASKSSHTPRWSGTY